MGHHISAIICPLPIDEEKAHALDLPFFIEGAFAVIALDASHSDYWTEKLGLEFQSRSDMIHDNLTTLAFAEALKIEKFALIQTDYFGGVGEQWATVYENGMRTFKTTEGGINSALSKIGVVKAASKDEFDTVGLGKYRDFDDYFEKYWDCD